MNAKKLLALLLALVLVFSLTACSKDKAEEPAAESESSGLSGLLNNASQSSGVEGKWVLTEAVNGTEGDEDYFVMYLGDYAQFMDVDPGIEFKADGTGSINMDGDSPESFTWTQDGNNINLTADGETMTLVYDPAADVITMTTDEDGEHGTVTFAREGSAAVEEARTKTSELGELFAALAGSGEWEDAEVDYPELLMNDSAVLSFTEDDFYLHLIFAAPEAGDYAFWATASDYVSIGAYNDSICIDSIEYASGTDLASVSPVTLEAGQVVYLELSTMGAQDVTVYAGTPEDVPSIEDQVPELLLDDSLAVTLEGSFSSVYCKFTAPEEGDYIIYSQGDVDTMAYAYATADDMYNYGEDIAYNDDGEGDYGNNFCLELSLEADQTVFIKVTPWSVDGTAEINLFAEVAGASPNRNPSLNRSPVCPRQTRTPLLPTGTATGTATGSSTAPGALLKAWTTVTTGGIAAWSSTTKPEP